MTSSFTTFILFHFLFSSCFPSLVSSPFTLVSRSSHSSLVRSSRSPAARANEKSEETESDERRTRDE